MDKMQTESQIITPDENENCSSNPKDDSVSISVVDGPMEGAAGHHGASSVGNLKNNKYTKPNSEKVKIYTKQSAKLGAHLKDNSNQLMLTFHGQAIAKENYDDTFTLSTYKSPSNKPSAVLLSIDINKETFILDNSSIGKVTTQKGPIPPEIQGNGEQYRFLFYMDKHQKDVTFQSAFLTKSFLGFENDYLVLKEFRKDEVDETILFHFEQLP